MGSIAEGQDILKGKETRAAKQTGLGALLHDFGGDADGAGGDFAHRGSEGVREDDVGAGGSGILIRGGRRGKEVSFHAIVDDEEGCGGRGGAEEHGGKTGVDAADGLAEREAGCC